MEAVRLDRLSRYKTGVRLPLGVVGGAGKSSGVVGGQLVSEKMPTVRPNFLHSAPAADTKKGAMSSGLCEVDQYVAAFVDEGVLTGKPDLSRRRRQWVNRFITDTRLVDFTQFNVGLIRAWLASLLLEGVAPKTVNNALSVLRTFADFLVRENAIGRENSLAEIKPIPMDDPAPRYLTDDEIATALRVADEHWIGAEVRLALLTGLRMGELRRLEWADVDPEARVLIVRTAKARKYRAVALSAEAVDVLRHHHEITGRARHVFPGRCRNGATGMRGHEWWTYALDPLRAAIPKFSDAGPMATGRGWHLLRHTWFSRAAQAGISIYKLSTWGGHEDVNFTRKRYAHLREGYDRDIERVTLETKRGGRSAAQDEETVLL